MSLCMPGTLQCEQGHVGMDGGETKAGARGPERGRVMPSLLALRVDGALKKLRMNGYALDIHYITLPS